MQYLHSWMTCCSVLGARAPWDSWKHVGESACCIRSRQRRRQYINSCPCIWSEALRRELRPCWRHLWDRQTQKKSHVIRLENWPAVFGSQYTQVTITRLQIGHTCTAHSYLSSGGDQLIRERCGDQLTVVYILIQCSNLDAPRKKALFIALSTAVSTTSCHAHR